MAKATVIDSVLNIKTVPFTHNAATEPGDIIVGNGAVLIAINKKDANVANAYVYEGRVTMPKTNGLAINVMDAVFFDSGAAEVNKTAAGNTACGHCVETAASGATTVDILLRTYVKA